MLVLSGGGQSYFGNWQCIGSSIVPGSTDPRTTPPIDTTNADLLIVAVGGTGIPTDTYSNSWAQIAVPGSMLMYHAQGGVGPGHSVTASAGLYGPVLFAAFSGATVAALDQWDPSTITPTVPDALIISAAYSAATLVGIGGLKIIDSLPYVGAVTNAIAMAWGAQPVPSTITPLWVPTPSLGTVFASFKPA